MIPTRFLNFNFFNNNLYGFSFYVGKLLYLNIAVVYIGLCGGKYLYECMSILHVLKVLANIIILIDCMDTICVYCVVLHI